MKNKNHEKVLREHVLYLLRDGGAHVKFAAAVQDVPAAVQGKRPKGTAHSPWELLEHLRIAQWDILEFMRNPKHVSPPFPAGYWPAAQVPPSENAWADSVASFRADSEAVAAMVADESNDLFKPIPHGDGQTILREALLVADHNAYHLGQLVLVRQLLGAWA
jgi:hypothetical protein